MLTCNDFLKELSDYLDQEVDPELRAQLEQHISECPNCWVVTDTTKKTIAIYQGAELYQIPEAVHQRLIAAIEQKAASKRE